MKQNEDKFSREQSPPHYDVLIISDSPTSIRLMTSFYELKGYSSKSMNSGLEALKDMQTSIPRYILMDKELYDLSGFEFLRRLKSDARLKDIPFTFFLEKSQLQKNKASQRRKVGFEGDVVDFFKF